MLSIGLAREEKRTEMAKLERMINVLDSRDRLYLFTETMKQIKNECETWRPLKR